MQSEKKKELIRSIKFTLFSISAGAIQYASFLLFFHVFGWTEWLSHLIALILSVLWNFTINRKFTFHATNNIAIAMLKVAAYYLVFTPLSTWWTATLTNPAGPAWNGDLLEILNMAVNFVTEFLFWRFVVFGKSVDTAQKKGDESQTEN